MLKKRKKEEENERTKNRGTIARRFPILRKKFQFGKTREKESSED